MKISDLKTKPIHWNNKKAKLVEFFLLSLWLMTSLGIIVISFLDGGVDFRGYYAATRVFLSGGNPYDYQLVASVLLEVTGEMGNNPYYYPPWFTWLFIPLTYLPYQIARLVWGIFNMIIWIFSVHSVSKLVDWPSNRQKRYAFFTLATITFAWITLRYEQAGIVVFGLTTAFLLSIKKEKWTQAGIWLALLLVKPNITLIIVLGISLWLLRNKIHYPVLVMIFTTIALLVFFTLITPGWYLPVFETGFGRGLTETLDGPGNVEGIRINTTMLDWLAFLGIQPHLSRLLYGAAIIIAALSFLVSSMRSKSILEITSLSTLISCAITPYALQYDYPPLVITFFWALSLPRSSSIPPWIILLLVGFICAASFWNPSIASRYWIIIGLIILVLICIPSPNTSAGTVVGNNS